MKPNRQSTSPKKAVIRLLEFLGPKGILLWLLLMLALQSVAYGTADVVRGLEYPLLSWAVLIAGTLAWLLALLPMSGRLAALLGGLVGLPLILIRVGQLLPLMGDNLRAMGFFLAELAVWYWEGPPDWTRVPIALLALWQDMSALLIRGWTWITALLAGTGVYDPVGTALVWSAGVWACAFWAGWWVRRRRRPLAAVLPGGALLAVVLSYTGASSLTLLALVGATLLLLAAVHFRERELHWIVTNVDFSRDLWTDVLAMASLLTVIVLLAAAIAPSISASDLVRWTRETFSRPRDEGDLAESLGLEQQPVSRERTPLERAAETDLPRRHLIGSGPELEEIVVMEVRTGEFPPAPSPDMLNGTPPRHYWRGLVYDRYVGNGWITTRADITAYSADERAGRAEAAHHRLLRQRVNIVGSVPTLHVAGTLVGVDVPYEVAARIPDDFFAATTEATSYLAESLVPVVNEALLRESGQIYPAWIRERYLQLPSTVPERVLALARDLTATDLTPYDRARSIEQYLREFPYTLDVPTPDLDQDIADYFLFDLRRGYCDYYATTMVVLARAAGVPTRMVIGYASGQYDAPNARYIVTEANAHAWVEVYFPTVGWVIFEPTGGLPGVDHAEEESEIIWPEPDVAQEDRQAARAGSVWRGIGLTLAGALLAGMLALGADGVFLLRLAPRETVTRLYRRLRRQARALQVNAQSGDTPRELAAALALRVQEIAAGRRYAGRLLAPAADDARALVAAYERAWYAPHPVDAATRREAARVWGKLRWRLWLAWLLRRLRPNSSP